MKASAAGDAFQLVLELYQSLRGNHSIAHESQVFQPHKQRYNVYDLFTLFGFQQHPFSNVGFKSEFKLRLRLKKKLSMSMSPFHHVVACGCVAAAACNELNRSSVEMYESDPAGALSRIRCTRECLPSTLLSATRTSHLKESAA